jgi:phosphate uptake regulator
MKRKLVKQGNNALTITLPKKWLDKYNLKAGNEVFIKEHEPEIKITAKPIDKEKKIIVDFDTYKEITPKYLHSLYRQGINEIELHYKSSSCMDEVYKTLSENIIGYEVVEQYENKAIIKSVADVREDTFESMFRRIFRINQSMLNSLNKILNEKKNDEIHSTLQLEKTNNKLTNYCRRSISKRLYEGQEIVLTYSVIEILERMGDEIKFTLKYINSNKELIITENELLLLKEANDFFKIAHEAYFSKEFNKIAKEGIKRKHLIEESLNVFKKAIKKDFYLMHYLINIIQQTAHILTYRLQIEFLQK